MDQESPEQFVSKYLIDNTYYLTALEFYCETYERTGVALEDLSQFFENSANFLMFEEMKSVSEISSSISESSCLNSDAIRIKDDRIAVLEHDIRILRDKLEKTKDKLQHFQENSADFINTPSNSGFLQSVTLSAQSSSSMPEINSSPAASDEDAIINQLISQYLQKKNLKLSSLAFNNETGIGKQKKKFDLPEEYNLLYIIRNFRIFEQNPHMNDEIQKLHNDLDNQNLIIAQLRQELKLAQQSNSELLKKANETDKQGETEDSTQTDEVQEQSQPPIPIKALSSLSNLSTSNHSFSNVHVPPTIELLDDIFSDMMQLMNVIDSSERRRIIKPLETIVRYHPVKETRIQCISLIFNIWEDPNEEQREIIVQSIKECCIDESKHINRIPDEVLPVVSQLLSSSNAKMLCLVALSVASFAPFCQSQLRSSLLLSIIIQLSEHSSPIVREASVRGGSLLVDSLIGDSDAADKLSNLLDLCKNFIFDPDANVQQAALQNFVPSLLNFTQSRCCVGREFCEFWLKLFFSFGLTGTSALAALRFGLCSKVLESSFKYIIPVTPGPDQQLIAEGAASLNSAGDLMNPNNLDDNKQVIRIPKTEYEWITNSLIPQLTKVAPTMFSQINIRKEADRFVATVCKSVGQQIVTEMIVPSFLAAIDKADGDLKEKIVTLFISSVASMCDQETFFTQSRNFLTYATNDLRGFKSRDVQEYFAPAFALITARDLEKRSLIFKLIDELSKSSRVAIKTAAVSLLCEILPTLDEIEIEKNVIPIIDKLAQSVDETLVLEVINCVGSVARFALSVSVLNSVKELFDLWIKDKRASVRMQTLRVFAVIINDVDEQFRDGFILSKLLDVSKDLSSCTDPGQVEQAVMLILHCIHSVNNPSDKTVKSLVKPTVDIIRQYEIIAQDPKLEEVVQKFDLDKGKRGK